MMKHKVEVNVLTEKLTALCESTFSTLSPVRKLSIWNIL